MTQAARFEEVLDECINRLTTGEAQEDILRAYPQHADALRPLLQAAARANVRPPLPSATARAQAMNGMLASVESTRSAGRSRATGSGGVGMMMGWFSKRPLAYRGLALLAGVALVGGVAAGASAAGAGPEPVREFFGFQSDSSIRVEFDGVIAGINDVDGELTVQTGSDVRTVIVTGATDLSDGGDAIAFGDLAVGDPVEIKGTLQLDNTILATRVHREDSLDDDEAAPGNATPAPNATPDDEDDEDDVDDNSGPGNADDDGEIDDVDDDEVDDADDGNSGEGSDDDTISEDKSGPGGAEDDELEDDSSGPGSGDDDELDDDSSDSGSGDDDDLDDDSSDSSSGDDDELDDDSSDSGSDVGPDDD